MRPAISCLTLCLLLPVSGMAAAQLAGERPLAERHTLMAAEATAAARPHDPLPTIDLSRLLEDSGLIAEAEATLLGALRALGPSVVLLQALAGFHNRAGDFEKAMHYLEEAAALEPSNPHAHHVIAAYYQEKAQKDFRISDEQKRAYVEAGLAAEERALALDPDFIDALVYKSLLLRIRSNLDASPTERERLIAEADALRNRAMQLQKMRARTTDTHPAVPQPPPVATSPRPGMMPPAPSASREDAAAADMYKGAVRLFEPVRGGRKGPRKIVHVDPVLPPAVAPNVRGIVVVEARVEPDGQVSHVRVVRPSFPLIDQAAVEAVRQWLFEPPMINGKPMPIIMTMTVSFTPPP